MNIELKEKAEQALNDVKARISNASDNYYYRTKKAVYRADDYVHTLKNFSSANYRQHQPVSPGLSVRHPHMRDTIFVIHFGDRVEAKLGIKCL